MTRWPLRRLGVGVAALVALGATATARGDDRATAEAILVPLEHDPARAAVVADAIKTARDALERGTRMRDANDEPRARLAEVLGREWAEVARDLARASDAERIAREARAALDDAGAHADRERSLLDEAIARQGRLRAEIEGLERTKRGSDRTASVGASLDAGAASVVSGRAYRGAGGEPPGARDGGASRADAGAGLSP